MPSVIMRGLDNHHPQSVTHDCTGAVTAAGTHVTATMIGQPKQPRCSLHSRSSILNVAVLPRAVRSAMAQFCQSGNVRPQPTVYGGSWLRSG